MIEYITKGELRGFASSFTLTEQAELRKSYAARSLAGTTFLSHSSKDDDLVVGATQVLEGHGARVYVDKVDPQMPPYTTEETADLLKTRINQTRKFVLLASDNSKDSRWVPWELGIADGSKGLRNIALFPAVDTQGESWTSWEYLGLYRRIVWGDLQGRPKPLWMVLDESRNTATELSQWLSN
jgi:hypothetical protein